MNTTVQYMNDVLNNDFKSLVMKDREYERNPIIQEYLANKEAIKALKGEIGNDMLNLFRTYNVQSIKGDVATVYVKDDYEILRDRLSAAQIVAMFDYNPEAFKITDKALRETIELAKVARANGDCSEGIQALLNIDLDKLRGPVKHSAVVRLAKF